MFVRAAVPVCTLKVALIFADPCDALDATPVLLTTATRGFDDVHWESNVMSCVVPSLKVPVYCWRYCQGCRRRESRVFGLESVWPTAIAVAIPFASISEIVGVKEVQVTPWSNG